MERDASITTTLFFGCAPQRATRSSYFDPEIAGGKGFSGVNGIANPPTANSRAWPPRRQSRTSRACSSPRFRFGIGKESISKATSISSQETGR
jgi:hypothetical protein